MPASVPADEPPLAAAILDDGRVDAGALLATLAHRLQARGLGVRGLLMTHPEGRAGCGPMVLVDLASGEAFPVSQDLGPGSASCRADLQGFARASRVLRDAVATGADLVISNRFGGLEATGGGFVAELLSVMAAGVPLLTVVAPRHLPDWACFTGGAAVLAADEAAIEAWVAGAVAGTSAIPAQAGSRLP
jgi:hypothetical protein